MTKYTVYAALAAAALAGAAVAGPAALPAPQAAVRPASLAPSAVTVLTDTGYTVSGTWGAGLWGGYFASNIQVTLGLVNPETGMIVPVPVALDTGAEGSALSLPPALASAAGLPVVGSQESCGVAGCGQEPIYGGVTVTTPTGLPLFRVSSVDGLSSAFSTGLLGSAILASPVSRLIVDGNQWTWSYGPAAPPPFPVASWPKRPIRDGRRTLYVPWPPGMRVLGRTQVPDAPWGDRAPTWGWTASGGGELWVQEPNPAPPGDAGPFPGSVEADPITHYCPAAFPGQPAQDMCLVQTLWFPPGPHTPAVALTVALPAGVGPTLSDPGQTWMPQYWQAVVPSSAG